MKMIKLDSADYQTKKEEVLNCTNVSRINGIKAKDLKIQSYDNIKLSDRDLRFTDEAKRNLFSTLGLSKNTLKYFGSLAKSNSSDADKKLTSMLITEFNKKSSKKLNIAFDERSNSITNVYSNKLISDTTYFEIIEKFIAKTTSAYLKSFYQSSNGDLIAVVNIPNLEFNFGMLSDEVFQTGLNFTLKPTGMSVSLHTTRLVCANGMTTENTFCTESVQVEKEVPGFLQQILSKDMHVSNITAFKTKMGRTYHTPASLGEILSCDSKLRSILGKDLYEPFSKNLSSTRLKNAFGDDIVNFHKDDHKFLKTDVSLWELTNEITAISSRIEREVQADDTGLLKGLDTYKNNSIQMLGGRVMFKEPDLIPTNIKQIF